MRQVITGIVLILLFFSFAGCNKNPDLTEIDPFELAVLGDLNEEDVSVDWVRTWGGPGFMLFCDLAVDDDGYFYCLGSFDGEVDFDPGEAEEIAKSYDNNLYFAKYSPTGEFIWVINLEGENFRLACGLDLDDAGNIYITGRYENSVDFDPSISGEFVRTAVEQDGFLASYDSDGNFRWVNTWPCATGFHVIVDNDGGVYVVSDLITANLTRFATEDGFIDIDPGPETSMYELGGYTDVLVLKIDTDGNYIWSRAYGGAESDNGRDITHDSENNIYIVGGFRDDVDFDPGPGTAVHTASGDLDGYLLSLSSDGDYRWSHTLGAQGITNSTGVCTLNNNVFMTGEYTFQLDFDPGPSEDLSNQSEKHFLDMYLISYTTNGDYQWASTIENYGLDRDGLVYGGPDGSIYTLVKNDVRLGQDMQFFWPHGADDVSLSRFTPDGDRIWDITWGGPGLELFPHMVVLNDYEFVVAGSYSYYLGSDDLQGVYSDMELGPGGFITTNDTYLMKISIAENPTAGDSPDQ